MKFENIKIWILCVSVMGSLFVSSCTDQWDDHVAVNTSTLSGTVMDAIVADTSLTSFAKMLKATGYDYVLRSGSEYTVFAPNNKALAIYASASDSIQKAIVKNHITFLKYNASQLADMKTLRSVNGKNLILSNLAFPSNDTESLCSNGILRTVTNVVMPKLNILEYLTNTIGKGKYEQVDWLLDATDSVADLDNSIQTGVNSSGKPVYDTLYVAYNRFLTTVDYDNEDSTYTFALLPDSAFDVLKAKYAKYMKPAPDNIALTWGKKITGTAKTRQAVMADSVATDALITDLTFPVSSISIGSQTDVNGVNVDINALGTISVLSNGSLQLVTNAGITIKDNKIKAVIIQGEDFNNALTTSCVITRIRSYASGGKDVYMGSQRYQYRDSLKDTNNDGVGDSLVTSKYFTYRFIKSSTSTESKLVNFWIEYLAKLYTCDYKIYWKAYDDISGHVHAAATNGSTVDPDYDASDPTKACASTNNIKMKLYASFNGYPALQRLSTTNEGRIINNWCDTSPTTASGVFYAFASKNNAGCNREQQVLRYRLNATWDASSQSWITDPGSVNESAKVLWDQQLLTVTTYGKTQFWVTNSYDISSTSSTQNGWIFLDYIRLEPQIDE